MMVRLRKTASALGVVLGMLLVSACNSEGGGDNEGEDTGGDSLSELSGLSAAPDNDNWLFFTSNAEDNAGLFGFNPQQPDNGTELIDSDANVTSNPYVFSAISSAEINDVELSDYRATHLFYPAKREETLQGSSQAVTLPDGYKRVSASQSVQSPSPSQVSSETDTAARYFFQNDLETPLNTAIAYLAGGEWHQIRVGDDAGDAPATFDADHKVSVPLGNGSPNGWLVIDEGDNDRLEMVDTTMNSQGAVLDANDDAVEGLAYVDMFFDLGLDSHLVALNFIETDENGQEQPSSESEVWLYTRGEPDSIEPLLNEQGEKLTFSYNALGGTNLPSAKKLVVKGDTLYFAHPSNTSTFISSGPQLYRVDQNGWSIEVDHVDESTGTLGQLTPSPFLIDAGNRLIWQIDNELRAVNTNTFTESTLFPADASTPILDSQGGWFYYNNGNRAVAARTDGSERIQLHDASWIGASSTGDGNITARQAKTEISEVFLLHDNGTLVAVSASDPQAGGVVLGQLDSAPEDVRLTGIRPGQHQLMQVEYTDSGVSEYEVIYVNTRQADSLRQLMDEPTDAGARPVYGQ